MIKGGSSKNNRRAGQSTVDRKSLEARSSTELWRAVEEMMDKPAAEIDGEFVDACLNILQDRAPVAEDYDPHAALQRLHDAHPAIFELDEKAAVASKRKPMFRYVGAIAAAMLCLVVTAHAFGYKPIQNFMKWVGDTIQIYSDPSGLMELPPDDPSEYHSLEEALEGCGASSAHRITWTPEDYAVTRIEVISRDYMTKVTAIYTADRGELILRILDVGSGNWHGAVESDLDGTAYEHNGITYYITSNYDIVVAVGMDGQYSYEINGQVTEDEIKKIIHSIV